MQFLVKPSTISGAEVTVPGDKSISHRAVMLGSIAEGRTGISGFLAGDDCIATMQAFRAMGVSIRQSSDTELVIDGVGLNGLEAPRSDLDLGNSGTAMRLLAGLMAGQRFSSTLTGDSSLTGRPMQRVITPLAEMGATITSRDGKPPLVVQGGQPLHGTRYEMPVASAQVKSAILLAALYATGRTTVVEPAVTRDHTERMLRAMGVQLDIDAGKISLSGGQSLRGCPIEVPGDLSSAAFIMLAVLLADRADVVIRNVGINPTRTGVVEILRGMGGDISFENSRELGVEPVCDLRVRASKLQGGEVDPALVSLAIDEFPVLFVAAAAAAGKTTFTGIGELRVKESDRISAMAQGLRALGIRVDEEDDGAVVHGGAFRSGEAQSFGDHRVAMSLAVAGAHADGPVIVQDVAAVDTSFPGFTGCLGELGIDIASVGKRAT